MKTDGQQATETMDKERCAGLEAPLFNDLTAIMYANEMGGYNFFADKELKFWGTKLYKRVYAGCYFITADWNFARTVRRFTVREARASGRVVTTSAFLGFATRNEAENWLIRKLASGVQK